MGCSQDAQPNISRLRDDRARTARLPRATPKDPPTTRGHNSCDELGVGRHDDGHDDGEDAEGRGEDLDDEDLDEESAIPTQVTHPE